MTAVTRVATINKAMAKEGMAMELVRGEGYFYFVPTSESMGVDWSVYVCYLSHLPLERWMEEARQAWANRWECGPTNGS